MSARSEGEPVARSRKRTLVWIAIAAGLAVFMPVRLPGIDLRINLSLFDLVVPGLFAWALFTGRIAWPARRHLLIVAGVLAMVVAHSFYIHWATPDASLPWLLRDTIKLCAIILLFAMLCGVFRDPALRAPASNVLTATLLVLIPPAIYLSLYQSTFTPRTIYAATIVGMYLLALRGSDWYGERTAAARALAGAGAIVLVIFAFYSKSMAFAALCTLLWIAVVSWTHFSRRALVAVGLAVLLVLWGGVHLWLPGIDVLKSIQPVSLERSLGIRVLLWTHTLDQIAASFPIGIGLGQFATTVHAVPRLALEGHEFAHSTFLGLVAELGLLGGLLSVLIIGLIVRAGIGWGWHHAVPYVALLVPLVLLHDAQGIRVVLVVVAIGVMHAGAKAARIATNSRRF